jgi:hypothetical protein
VPTEKNDIVSLQFQRHRILPRGFSHKGLAILTATLAHPEHLPPFRSARSERARLAFIAAGTAFIEHDAAIEYLVAAVRDHPALFGTYNERR